MSNEKATDSGFDLEQFINLIAQRLFPRWYARHAVKEIEISAIEDINPKSYLCHRWLSLINVHQAAADSLTSSDQQWHSLAELLKKMSSENEYPRSLSISAIHGIKVSQCEEDFPDLLSYGATQANQIPQETDNEFNRNITLAFPEAKQPFHICYREFDGRYYYLNEDEPRHFAALLMQCKKQQRDYNLTCMIHVESIQGHMLDRLRSGFWMLLMKREYAYQLYQLLKQAKFECEIAEFEWRRSDLVFFIARKNDQALNDIIFNLLSNHNSTQVVDWGRLLSRSHFPFQNK
ncbi:conserved hypothetical protein [Oleispira antarctica RB-8]|uniref:Uncharacterized protein n=1 Tax=Oleispira antarctica RB-8 TaxID=698738 RepID=R4YSM7_OLEAN|nr:conserved hypothetical protein [Oleispira antarctica RB-8]